MKSECYAYDAAGRLVREGDRAYRYGYLDKVLSVTDGKRSCRYAYHVDGQLARADYGDGRAEDFAWDGLALVRRGDESFVNEPHVGDAPKKLRFGGKPRAKRSARRARKGPRGNPVVSSKGATYFNDALGTTVGVREGRGAARKGAKRRYTAAALAAFGEPVPVAATSRNSNIRQFDHSIISSPFFTGKPQVEGLGRVFLYRNYRSDLAKWQTADPLGYPDGWNQLAYGRTNPLDGIDLYGAYWVYTSCWIQKSCWETVYMQVPGLPLDVDIANIYKISKSLFQIIAQLIADRIQGDLMQTGLADFLSAYIAAAEAEGCGSSVVPENEECLEKIRKIMNETEYSTWEFLRVKPFSMDYSATASNNLVTVSHMRVLWCVEYRYWVEE